MTLAVADNVCYRSPLILIFATSQSLSCWILPLSYVLIWSFVSILAPCPPESSQSNILCPTFTNMDRWLDVTVHCNFFTQSKTGGIILEVVTVLKPQGLGLNFMHATQNCTQFCKIGFSFSAVCFCSSIYGWFPTFCLLFLSPQARINRNMCSITPTAWECFGPPAKKCKANSSSQMPGFTQYMIHFRGKYCELTHLSSVTVNPTLPFYV